MATPIPTAWERRVTPSELVFGAALDFDAKISVTRYENGPQWWCYLSTSWGFHAPVKDEDSPPITETLDRTIAHLDRVREWLCGLRDELNAEAAPLGVSLAAIDEEVA